jgi:hypothetical protein
LSSAVRNVNLIEQVKAMDGVEDVTWGRVKVVGRKNHISTVILAALKRKGA